MTTENTDAFWELAEEFINLANARAEQTSPDAVNSALQFAAARFGAFIVASNTDDLADEKDGALKHLGWHYRQLLDAQLEDYIANPLPKPKEKE